MDIIDQIRLSIGDTESSPFYPMFSDDEILWFYTSNRSRLRSAIRSAANALLLQFAQMPSKQLTGDNEVWYDKLASEYRQALRLMLDDKKADLPAGIKPYFGGTSWAEVCAFNRNPDNVRSKLTTIQTCDGDDPCFPCGTPVPVVTECGCQ